MGQGRISLIRDDQLVELSPEQAKIMAVLERQDRRKYGLVSEDSHQDGLAHSRNRAVDIALAKARRCRPVISRIYDYRSKEND